MCSRGTHSCGDMQKKRVHLERADVVSWNTPRTHNHSLKALMRASAACCLWLDQAHARETRVSEPQTHETKGDK